MRYTLDSNILVYALDIDEAAKHDVALNILRRADSIDLFLTAQALGEFINAVRKRNIAAIPVAAQLAQDWSLWFHSVPTGPERILAGAERAMRYKLQFWDSVILSVAISDGAQVFLTEGMQDGLVVDGLRLINPFKPENARLLEDLRD